MIFLAAALSAFATIMRPGRRDMQQLEDLAMPLLQCASTRGKRHAANALAHLEEAPRRLVLALANEPVKFPRRFCCVLPFAPATLSILSPETASPMRAP